jgi:lysophospholipase L1-like esterase
MKRIDYLYEGPFIKNLGRYYVSAEKKAKMFTFSCSGFEVRFKGTSLKAEIIATECHKPQGEAAIEVIVDETKFAEGKKITLDKERAVYALASGLPYGEHRLRIYKRTESSCSLTGWTYIETDGEFLPIPEEKHLKIEIYGDSITAGNGVEGVEGDENFETRTENALISYEALAAEKLKADFSVIAIGGYPVYKSPWNGFAVIKTIPEMFSFADYTWGTDHTNIVYWDNRKFVPDIVIVNLGTNDDQYILPLKEPLQSQEKEGYKQAMRDFIARIFSAYPQCKIVLCLGMIKVSLTEDLLKEVASEYKKNVYFLPFDSLKVGGYMANGGHPNRAMHIKAGQELYDFLKKII